MARLALLASAMELASCGGAGTSSGSGGTTVLPPATPTPSPSPSPTPSPTPTPSPLPSPTPVTDPSTLYDVQPDLAGCTTGSLKASVRTEFLARVNALRALHGLAPVTYSSADNGEVDQSSLMMAANRTLSHTPPSSWLCYSSLGAQGAGSSNLIGSWGTGLRWASEDDNLAGWMNEHHSISIGHRRWILDPFLGKISYGRTSVQVGSFRSDTATMKVFNFTASPPLPSSAPPFVAYPYGDYPERYFAAGDILSFSVVASTSSRFANSAVSFAAATVRVSDATGDLPITNVASDNSGYGLPNSIQWKVTGLQRNVTYTVRISNVAGAPNSSYQYSFKIIP